MRRSVSSLLPACGVVALYVGALMMPASVAAAGPAILRPATTNVYFNPVPLNVYGGFYSSAFSLPMLPSSSSYLGSYWWAGPNSSVDPRQAGYNPSGGYPWESVAALLLSTSPSKARVTLDGTDIGTANYLGPIQLPMGEHTVRVEAPGYEPSETVLKVEQPILQQLDVRLERAKLASKDSSKQ